MLAVVAALVPVFLLIATGFALRRWLIREDAHWVGLEHILYYVMFPALLVESLSRADLSKVPVLAVGGTLLAAVLLMSALCLALRPLLARHLGTGGPAFTSLFQGATRWQTFVALAVAGNLYGDLGLALASVAMVAMIPLLNALAVWVLARYATPARPDWRSVALVIVQNPFIWACGIGLALNPLAAWIPGPAHAFVDALGRSSLALGLLIVGAGLRVGELIHPNATMFLACALKLILMPALAIAIGAALGLSGINLAVVACCASVPASSNSYVLARQMGGDAPLMAQILTFQTALAAATMPVVLSLVS
ncbi:MAG: AEC family transporter [Alphaproteobacteria bacterium]